MNHIDEAHDVIDRHNSRDCIYGSDHILQKCNMGQVGCIKCGLMVDNTDAVPVIRYP